MGPTVLSGPAAPAFDGGGVYGIACRSPSRWRAGDLSVFLVDGQASGVRCRQLRGCLSCQYEVSFESVKVPTALDDGRGALEVRHRSPGRRGGCAHGKGHQQGGVPRSLQGRLRSHAGQDGLIEYGIAAHTQMSGTLAAYSETCAGTSGWPRPWSG